MLGVGYFCRVTPSRFRYGILVFAAGMCLGAEPVSMRLWPGAAPGDVGVFAPERDPTTAKDPVLPGGPTIRVTNVSVPTITVYRPPADKDTGAVVMVFPGGSYVRLAMNVEGTDVCSWLNSIGVTAVLLKYRVPMREGVPRYTMALQDAQRAVGLVRLHSKEWGIDPDRLGTVGFSAGADLSAVLCTNYATRTYPRLDTADDLSCLPDFQMLIYPGWLSKGTASELSPEVAVSSKTPPSFLVQAEDDPVHVENVIYYALALKQVNVPMELNVYPKGGHGYGMRPTGNLVASWPRRAGEWMASRGILGRN
jgi:acetyl esterase/lipase